MPFTTENSDQRIVLASSNAGKIVEIRQLLSEFALTLVPQTELAVTDADETGTTFIENAIIKARHACAHTGLPALADDSGLSVPALGGEPGVFSARYAGPQATDQDRINKLIKNMVGMTDRRASFHCVIAFMQHAKDPTPIICHGRWQGKILDAPQGNQGFGYDPIFWVEEKKCSAAELAPAIKNQMSHRAMALAQLKDQLNQLCSLVN